MKFFRVPALALLAAVLCLHAVTAAALLANFGNERAGADVLRTGNWVVQSADNHGLPFVIVDKLDAKVYVFDRQGQLLGAAPVYVLPETRSARELFGSHEPQDACVAAAPR